MKKNLSLQFAPDNYRDCSFGVPEISNCKLVTADCKL
jgi:hypothetical protein